MKFDGKDNYGKPKSEYLETIKEMSPEELFAETKQKIWLSAFANNNPRSDFHWQCDACYDEWKARGKLEQYTEAWKAASGN